ncbi:MAG: sodium:calcium antiporter [Candidatus Eisenbacteria bacterium]|nr:sodium:calcium antiporter [Candidatus Latescibacterota bacterium]MBD3302184.1 sodium:calcium antiporter [Candidatus Eisenbacteria bacterium]
MNLTTLPLEMVLVVFLAAAVTIAVAGTRIARVADRLADATGWGEAIFGAVFLGLGTSLPGIVTSITAAADGHAELSISNALGGIAAQTAFLAIADIFYRKANLEHAAASLPNMMQGALLIVLLMGVGLFATAPQTSLFAIHPGSIVLFLAYFFGVRMIGTARRKVTWRASPTPETVPDVPDPGANRAGRSTARLWLRFCWLGLVVALGGYLVARSGLILSARTGLSETVVGALFTAVATSLPELVTCLAAVRAGALTLAVGNIIGGNTFDVLFVATSDLAYRQGSIYGAFTDRQLFLLALTATLTGILLLGLLRREKRGIANIGFESFLVLALYLASLVLLASW